MRHRVILRITSDHPDVSVEHLAQTAMFDWFDRHPAVVAFEKTEQYATMILLGGRSCVHQHLAEINIFYDDPFPAET